MCFEDFRSIFNKIFLCQDFPPNIIDVRFYDEWNILLFKANYEKRLDIFNDNLNILK